MDVELERVLLHHLHQAEEDVRLDLADQAVGRALAVGGVGYGVGGAGIGDRLLRLLLLMCGKSCRRERGGGSFRGRRRFALGRPL